MIKGIGNDIVEVERIRQAIERYGMRFYKKIFTHKEIAYCLKHRDPTLCFAGRFSAKEAIAKAFGTGFGRQVSFHDISIEQDGAHRPYPKCSDALNERFDSPQILVSISHCTSHATAVAIWVH